MLWGGVVTSCSNGSEEEYQPNIKTISNVDDVTFAVTKASVGEENTNIVFTYDRSANGAKEKITIKDCNIEVLFNGEKITTINKLDFALNEYGDFMGNNATQYQCKISIGKKVSLGDTVKVVFTSKTGDVSGEGANSAQIDTLTISLIDNDKDAGGDGNYYNELVENDKEYQKLFPNGNVGGDNGEEQENGGGTGTGNGGEGEGNGSGHEQGNGGNQGGGNSGGNQGGDGGNSGLTPTTDPDVKEGWTAITVGNIENYKGNGGIANYTVTKNNNGSITISHDAAMALYASCSFKTNFGDNNTLYTKITNNSDVAATVQVQVNKAGTEENEHQPTPTVTAVYVDKKKQSGASEYSVEVSIPAKGSVVIANKFDASKNPDTVAISLNSQEKIAGTVAKGNITVSGISMKKVTDDSELGTDEPPAKGEEIVFDFTKTETVKNDEDKDVVKLDKVTYCSADPSKFSAEDGVALEVDKFWDGAFKIATESLDLSNKNCIIEYKIDEGWEYTSNDGKKCLIQLISKEHNSGEHKAIELSQGEFANDPVKTGSWQIATIDNIYKNDWDVVNESGVALSEEEKKSYVGADLTKISVIKINTTDGKGTIHIKSIKFVDKK